MRFRPRFCIRVSTYFAALRVEKEKEARLVVFPDGSRSRCFALVLYSTVVAGFLTRSAHLILFAVGCSAVVHEYIPACCDAHKKGAMLSVVARLHSFVRRNMCVLLPPCAYIRANKEVVRMYPLGGWYGYILTFIFEFEIGFDCPVRVLLRAEGWSYVSGAGKYCTYGFTSAYGACPLPMPLHPLPRLR